MKSTIMEKIKIIKKIIGNGRGRQRIELAAKNMQKY